MISYSNGDKRYDNHYDQNEKRWAYVTLHLVFAIGNITLKNSY